MMLVMTNIFKNSNLYKKLETNQLDMSPSIVWYLKIKVKSMTFIIIGDEVLPYQRMF